MRRIAASAILKGTFVGTFDRLHPWESIIASSVQAANAESFQWWTVHVSEIID